MDLGAPLSYLTGPEHADVYTRDEWRVGRLEHVLADEEDDIFDGIIVRLDDGGNRFVDAPFVEGFYERGVLLTLDARDAQRLPEPSANPAALEVDPDDAARSDLELKLRRAWDYLTGRY
jgi:hypothetical protein